MTNDSTGRTPRQTTGGSPAASTIAIIVTVIAVVAGFFILRQIRDDDDDGDGGGTPTETTLASSTTAAVASTTPAPTTSTTAPLVVEGTSVVVANASTANGAAGRLTTALGGKGFTTSEAVNATVKLAESKVQYDASNPSAKAVADSVARAMGGVPVETLPSPPQVQEGVLAEGVGVLVLLGDDRATKTLDEMAGGTTTTTAASGPTTSTLPGATTSSTG